MGGAHSTYDEDNRQGLVIPPNEQYERYPTVVVKSLHVACCSDLWEDGEDYVGFVLYSYKNQAKWVLGSRSCQPGYIVVKKSSSIQKGIKAFPGLGSEPGVMHGSLFRMVFGCSINDFSKNDLLGAGFSVQDAKFKFNSWTFNAANPVYQDGNKAANPCEHRLIEKAVKLFWKSGGKQHTLEL